MNDQSQNSPDFPSKMIVCVGAVVLRDQRVLFVRQTYGERLKGRWTLPWGFAHRKDPTGPPEPPEAAAIRETREEGGVTAEVEGLLGIQSHPSRKTGEPRLCLLFLCRHVSGEPTPDDEETDKATYLSLEELDALGEPIDEFCEWLARRVLQGEHHIIPPEPMNPYCPHLAFL